MTNQEFIEYIGRLASLDMQHSGILASLTIAQAIKESGWGKSELAIKANALFGIKHNSDWNGKVYNKDTGECYDGKNYVTVNATFRAYDNWEDSVRDHSIYLCTRKIGNELRYKKVIGEVDYKKACFAIKEAGYATGLNYAEGLISLIEQHNLTRFDNEKEVNKMKIALTVGHSKLKNGNYTSANGVINEYLYNKELAPLVAKYLKELGAEVTLVICPEGQFTKAAEEKAYKLNIVNTGGFDLVVELHLNAGGGTGAEVLYISNAGKAYADRVQAKLATIFRDRGVKKRDNLYMLNSTKPPAIMIESFFCDNAGDCNIGKDKDRLARLIAEGITGKNIADMEIPTPEGKLYRVQCGAFKNLTNAESYRNIIIDMGYQAFVKYISPYYKVQVGAFGVKENAEKLSSELSGKGISNFIV